MKKLPTIIFTLLTLIIFTLTIGCNHNGVASKRMDSAEALMDSMPDSALCILSEIDQASLRNDGEKARHALLYTQALDKNYMDLSDDSLISLSVKYFSKKKDIPNLIRSYYYQGRVEYHKDIFTPAILSYFKAKELADDNGDPFWAGMACRGISDIFMQSYNAAEELAYARKEYCLIKKTADNHISTTPFTIWDAHFTITTIRTRLFSSPINWPTPPLCTMTHIFITRPCSCAHIPWLFLTNLPRLYLCSVKFAVENMPKAPIQ